LFDVLVLYKLLAGKYSIYEQEAINWFVSSGCGDDSSRDSHSVRRLALT